MGFFGMLFMLLIGFCLGLFLFYKFPKRFNNFIESFLDLFKKNSKSDEEK